MCTFFTYKNGNNYFGRNMDINTRFGESFLYIPKEYKYSWERNNKYFVFGIGVLNDAQPAFFDAINEKGISMALLNFEGYSEMKEYRDSEVKLTIDQFIAYILSQYGSLDEIKRDLEKIYLKDIFNLSGLKGRIRGHIHFIVAKGDESIVIEPDINGLNVYDNPIGVLTNSPDFKAQMTNLQNYSHLRRKNPGQYFGEVEFSSYGQGLGAFGLPGDSTPMSRFVRAAFLKYNSVNEKDENSNIVQIFRILDKVSMLRGEIEVDEKLESLGRFDETTYSVVCNMDEFIYYLKTYDNPNIQKLDIKEIEDEKGVQKFPFKKDFEFEKINTGDI
ncbi:MAG: linear amide C-N hydrolase [Andreesenia angusta]|nr:linear amide C-N hydrolase [Andreesenia angusta]